MHHQREKTHGTLFQAVQLEKLIIGILVFLIIGVAAFNVLCTTIMSVRSKEREIAILKTIGASDFTIVIFYLSRFIYINVGYHFWSHIRDIKYIKS